MAALLCSLYHCVPFFVAMNKEWKVLAVFFFFLYSGSRLGDVSRTEGKITAV